MATFLYLFLNPGSVDLIESKNLNLTGAKLKLLERHARSVLNRGDVLDFDPSKESLTEQLQVRDRETRPGNFNRSECPSIHEENLSRKELSVFLNSVSITRPVRP